MHETVVTAERPANYAIVAASVTRTPVPIISTPQLIQVPPSLLFGGGTGAPVSSLINIVTKEPTGDAHYAAQILDTTGRRHDDARDVCASGRPVQGVVESLNCRIVLDEQRWTRYRGSKGKL